MATCWPPDLGACSHSVDSPIKTTAEIAVAFVRPQYTPAQVALKLQRPLPDDMLEIVDEGKRSDQPEDGTAAAGAHA